MGMEDNFNKPNIENEEKEAKLAFPHGEEAVRMFKKEYPESTKQIEMAKNMYEVFFKQEMENISIYKSKEGIEYPYTNINVASLAKELYQKYSKTPLKENLEKNKEQTSIKREFVLESFLITTNGNPFTFVEEAMHQAIMNLPRALEDLKNGIEPQNIEVYTLGSPTNLLGKMTTSFYDEMKKDPFRNLGKVYAELIEEKINLAKANNNEKVSTELYGISMGAGIAAMTGEKLLENENFTQNPELKEEDKTLLQIRAVLPVTLSRSKIKKIQIPLGFFYDSTKALIGNPYVRKIAGGEIDFIKKVNKELEKRGIFENMTPEQKEMKTKMMPRLILALGEGLTLKPDTIVNEVYGLKDSTTYTPSLKEDAEMQKELHPNTLGSTVIPRERENSRTFVTNASHPDIPASNFYRSSEINRIKVAAEKLERLNQ